MSDEEQPKRYPRRELAKSKITSKGQITLPIEVRERLGVKQGDSVKFIADEDGRTIVLPVRDNENVFAQFIGVAKAPPGFDSVAWVRDMRDDEYEAEETRKRLQTRNARAA
jgi:antitoxin PrlF